jgi:hypothetical protein
LTLANGKVLPICIGKVSFPLKISGYRDEIRGNFEAGYTGDWQQGQRHGSGTKKWAAGVYTGEWEKHRQTCGKYVYPDGDVYEGCYQSDGVTPTRRTQRQIASEKRRSTCQHLYQGRVFKRENFFGHLNYIVIGFSPNQGRATVKAEHDGSMSEISCIDILE